MTYVLVAPERRPHDMQCELSGRRAWCQCRYRWQSRSDRLPERPVWWTWLHGTPRTPYEWSVARRCWEETS